MERVLAWVSEDKKLIFISVIFIRKSHLRVQIAGFGLAGSRRKNTTKI